MENKREQAGLLVLKSTTAFNSFVIVIVAVVVLYNHQRVNEIELHLTSCRSSIDILRENVRSVHRSAEFSSSVRLNRKVRYVPVKGTKLNNTKASLLKASSLPTKPLSKVASQKAQTRAIENSNSTAKQNINSTDLCKLCERECFPYKVRNSKTGSNERPYKGRCVFVQGPPGPPGPPGRKGSRGKRGRSRRGREGPRGRMGPVGPPGKQGPLGPPGPPGERGARGIIGMRGPIGQKGIKGDTSVVGIKGDKGDPGDLGPSGEKGMKGDIGMNGNKGEKGDRGGQKGDTGTKGEQGTRGEIGPRGCSGTLIVKPSFEKNQELVTVNEDDTNSLVCNASSNPASRVTWLKDNTPITGSRYTTRQKVFRGTGKEGNWTCPSDVPQPTNQGILIVQRIQAQDAGVYTCRATNFMGSAEYRVNVTVQLKVRFTSSPRNTTVIQNNNVELSCRATGFPKPLITWHKKGGEQMPSSYSVVNGNLRIKGVKKSEEGFYVCIASNVLGFQQAEAKITVNVPPQFAATPQSHVKVRKGKRLRLPCSARGTPNPSVTWSKVGGLLPRGRSEHDGNYMTIQLIEFGDRGVYVCTARNIIKSVTTQTNVTVLIRPEVITRPKSVEISYRGKNKTLPCKIFGFPPPNITWSGPSITRQKAVTVPNGLLIPNVQYLDSGNHYCRASNALGSLEVKTLMIVQDVVGPGFTVKPPPFAAFRKNQRLSVTCGAYGNPKPSVTWSKNGRSVSTGVSGTLNEKTLVITSLNTGHQGNYTCTAANDIGDSVTTIVFIDIDECLGSSHGCNTKCVNYPGSFRCLVEIRLRGSSSHYEGRVEVFRNGRWGTVCDDSWDLNDARVVCRQLGFSGAREAPRNAKFGQGAEPTWMDNVACTGSEFRLQDCSHRGWGVEDCSHSEDAGVVCF